MQPVQGFDAFGKDHQTIIGLVGLPAGRRVAEVGEQSLVLAETGGVNLPAKACKASISCISSGLGWLPSWAMRFPVDSSAAAGLEKRPFCIPTRCSSEGLPGLYWPFWVKGMASKGQGLLGDCETGFCCWLRQFCRSNAADRF